MSGAGVREFLLVHESSGTEWFNKERWELLVHALFAAGVVAAALEGISGAELGAAAAAARDAMTELVAAADRAGYRVTVLTGTSPAD